MNDLDTIAFDGPDMVQRLAIASALELDALDFGVVEMDAAGMVLRYNTTESRYSGLPRERVVGRHFFQDVAPCCNNRRVAQRYEAPVLDETMDYTFALRMKPVPVVLRLLRKAEVLDRMYLMVRWT